MIRVGILLITAALLIAAVLISGMGGYVSPSQNLEIRTWYDLDAVRNNLDGNYTLMNDLDSTTAGYTELASSTANGGKGWQPIAIFRPWAATTFTGFMGTFDGQGYEIRDLFINRPGELGAGLFGEVGQDGVIKDIGVVNATVTGNGWMGLFAVVDEGGRIEDISVVNATVTGEDFVGGLVGVNWGTVSNSYSAASVTGSDYVGGLVGENSYGTVSDSYSTGSVTGNYTVGGLVGSNYQATVSNSYSAGSLSGNNTIGGLVGWNYQGTVSNSFWDIETSGQATSDGGTGRTTTEMEDIATFSGATWSIVAVANPDTRDPSYVWNIVDDETYPFLSWQSVITPQNQQPIEIVSVLGPLPPFNPGGPVVEITLKNVGVEPVISLTATLKVDTPFDTSFDFIFNITPSNPLQPNRSTSDTLCLIGGGFSNNVSYPLTINATLQSGGKFVYTKLVQIVEPPHYTN